MAKFLLVCLSVGLVFMIVLGALVYGRAHTSGERIAESTGLFDRDRDDVVEYTVEEVATGLEVPWSIAFTSDTRMLVTERPGRLRVIENGQLQAEPLHTFSEVSTVGEEGLMSVVVDPDYQRNKFIYLSVAYEQAGGMAVKIMRFTDEGDRLENEAVMLDGIPAAKYHAGCRLAFGPDGKLYISTGDSFDKQLAQDLDSLAGKILRINADGSIPNDNPFESSPVWSYGHRNPQGLAWDEQGNLYASEHGPSIIDGPAGGDEINLIEKGKNYGWPLVSHGKLREGTEPAVMVFTPAEAPASLMIYSGEVFPQFQGNIFFGALVGQGLVRLISAADGLNSEKLFTIYGRIREVVESPDGLIYFTTSNRDGRGKAKTGDDHIYRLVPVE